MSHFIDHVVPGRVTGVALPSGTLDVEPGTFKIHKVHDIPYAFEFKWDDSSGQVYGDIDQLQAVYTT